MVCVSGEILVKSESSLVKSVETLQIRTSTFSHFKAIRTCHGTKQEKSNLTNR